MSDILRAYLSTTLHLSKVFFQLLYGIWELSKLKYAPVSIFGGTHLSSDSIYIKKARDLAFMLAENDIPVLTGGGPGIMEAASCGTAYLRKNVVSNIGITVKGLDKFGANKCVETTIIMDYFFARKLLLISYSVGFALFPGGYGTLDELFELLTLIQTNMRKKAPIILIGVEFWSEFIEWVKNYPLKMGLIRKDDFSLLHLTDDINEVFELLKVHCYKKKFAIR